MKNSELIIPAIFGILFAVVLKNGRLFSDSSLPKDGLFLLIASIFLGYFISQASNENNDQALACLKRWGLDALIIFLTGIFTFILLSL